MNPLTEIYKRIRMRHTALLLVIIAVTAAIAVYSICVTQYSISFSEALEVIHNHRYHIVPEDYRGGLVDFLVWDGLIPRSIGGVLIGAILGAIIMVVGYTLGRAYVYSTPAYAVLKLPFQILQAGVGAVVGPLLYWKAGLGKLFHRLMPPMH